MVGVEERGSRFNIHKDLLAFAGMVMVEIILVGGTTLYKSASVDEIINTYVYTFYCGIISLIFLLPCLFLLHRRRGIPPIKISIVIKIFMLSVLVYMAQILGYIGLKYGSPTLLSIMSNLSPGFTFLLAFLFRMETVHLRNYTSQAKIAGTIMSISGAIIATLYSGPSLLSTSMNNDWIIGGILLAAEYLLVSFVLVFQAKILTEYSLDLVVLFVFLVSGVFVSGLATLVMARDLEAWKLKVDVVSASELYSGFFLGFFNVLVQFWVLRVKGPVYVAMFKPITIIIAVVMGITILGDSLHLGSVLGGIIITLGFYVVVWAKAKEEEQQSTLFAEATVAPLLQPDYR